MNQNTEAGKNNVHLMKTFASGSLLLLPFSAAAQNQPAAKDSISAEALWYIGMLMVALYILLYLAIKGTQHIQKAISDKRFAKAREEKTRQAVTANTRKTPPIKELEKRIKEIELASRVQQVRNQA